MSSTTGFGARQRQQGNCMTVFTIDAENNITIFASLKEIPGSEEGTETFTNQAGSFTR